MSSVRVDSATQYYNIGVRLEEFALGQLLGVVFAGCSADHVPLPAKLFWSWRAIHTMLSAAYFWTSRVVDVGKRTF